MTVGWAPSRRGALTRLWKIGLELSIEVEIPKSELEQWDLAARLLGTYGDEGIAVFVEDQMRARLEDGDAVQGQRWRAMIDKLAALMTTSDRTAN